MDTIGISGNDLHEIARHAMGNEPVLFQDAEGKLHRIYTAITTRCEIGDYYGSVTILRESTAKDFIMRVCPPTSELQQKIDEYNDAEYLQSKIDAHTKRMEEQGITSEQMLEECRIGDLLTWQDVRRIVQIADEYIKHTEPTTTEEEYYEQVLKEFQDGKD